MSGDERMETLALVVTPPQEGPTGSAANERMDDNGGTNTGSKGNETAALATAAREGYRIPRIQKVLAMSETTEEEKRDAKRAKWKRAVARKTAREEGRQEEEADHDPAQALLPGGEDESKVLHKSSK